MKDKTVKDYVDAIPEDMRGHVFHELGKSLGHKGGVTAQDDSSAPGVGDGSGDNGPRPTGGGH